MKIIESIRSFVKNCPYLDPNGTVNVDYLTNEPVNYSIDSVPSVAILKEDINGNTLRQYLFTFASQNYYGSDTLRNMQNSGFFEDFAAWLEIKTKAGELPVLEPGKKSIKIYASGLGFIESTTEDSARYVIQCGLQYEQEA